MKTGFLFHNNRPISCDRGLIESLISHELIVLKKLAHVELYIGLEHSAYVASVMDQALHEKKNPEDIIPMFFDDGRFTGKKLLSEYLRHPENGHPSSAQINPALILSNDLLVGLHDIRCFAGSIDNITSLHFDWNPFVNVLINLVGRKKIRLIDSAHSSKLQGYCNFSSRLKMIPDLAEEFTLNEGEGIIIPPLWWHQVEYKTTACSISLRYQSNHDNSHFDHLYPSWKIVQRLSESRNGDGFMEALNEKSRNLTPEKKFAAIEEMLGFDGNDEAYDLWAKGYLMYKSLRA